MTTLTAPSTASAPARFRDLVASEWIKLWSLRSTWWGLGLGALAVLAGGITAAQSDYENYPSYGAGIRASFVPYWALNDAFSINACLIAIMTGASIGAIAVVGEYSTGLIRTTFAAVPARRAVLAAKMLTVTSVLAAFGVAVAAASFAVSQAILDGRGVGMSYGDRGVLPSLAVSALMAPVCGLIGMGLGSVIRHTAAAIITTVVALILIPLAANSPTRRWAHEFHNAMPIFAWKYLSEPGHGHVPYGPTALGSWLVLAVWPLVAAAVALVVVARRDV
jgi:ABC-2 type transport system permease protein